MQLDFGVAVGYTPMPYQTAMGSTHTAYLSSLYANVGATYQLAAKLSVARRGRRRPRVQTLINPVITLTWSLT